MTLAGRFREIGLTAAESRRTPPRHAALRDDPAAIALRVFRDAAPVSPSEAACLGVPPDLLVADAGQLRSAYRLDFVRDLYLFSDWPSDDSGAVLPPGETTAILYRAACPACPVESVLDLGCGSGTLALLLAPMTKRVVGSDLNPRAVMLARLNAEVNGIGGVEFRQGSLYEPVPVERFDLIVSQPPYVPRPPGTPHHLFLHGGPRGDELAREIIAGAPAHLTETGRALIFSDWPLMESECLADRIPGVQAKVTLHASPAIEPASYAASYGKELERYFAKQRIVGIRQCLTVLEHGAGMAEHLVLPHEWSRSV